MDKIIRFSTASQIILQSAPILGWEYVPLTGALERVTAADIHSVANVPSFNNSAMDGFVVRSRDVKKASDKTPVLLEVVEDVRAGDLPRRVLKAGQAIRIMTGAPVPKGADSVVMVERTARVPARDKDWVHIYAPGAKGDNIREAGHDIRKGERVILKGTLLTPAHVGLLASLGMGRVRVVRRPRIAILATGSELVEIGMRLKPGKIYSSNTYTLCSQVLQAGGEPVDLGTARDDMASLEKKVRRGLQYDILITSGGVSVGEYDFVKDVLKKTGARIRFWKVAIRPGKPLVFGQLGKTLIFGLPGNPVSSMVGFETFVKPALFRMAGRIDDHTHTVKAIVTEEIIKRKGLLFFLRAKTHWHKDRYQTRTTGPQGSSILKSMALANSLIVLPEHVERVKKGQEVDVRFLD